LPTSPSPSTSIPCPCSVGSRRRCRPPRFHTVRYAGVLAPASKMRPRIVPKPPATPANDLEPSGGGVASRSSLAYRQRTAPWAISTARARGTLARA
jgi:hypothetical protein